MSYLKAEDIRSIKERIKAEFERRNGYGSLEEYATKMGRNIIPTVKNK